MSFPNVIVSRKSFTAPFGLLALALLVYSARADTVSFKSSELANDVNWWWAITFADLNEDGIQDLVHIDTNSTGGYLGYRLGKSGPGLWEKVVVAETAPDGGKFASGDLETGDFDGDGDVDLIGVSHPGEWSDASATAKLYWYENPSWEAHFIGDSLGAVKDISVADFDDDGRQDLAVLNFHNHQLRVYQQKEDGSFSIALDYIKPGLHEGMDVGDFDGNGTIDIAANGYAFLNSGSFNESWQVEIIDERWFTQTGNWSRNATKNACADIDGDGRDEVFISHSERSEYPILYYTRSEDGVWVATTVAESLSSCHTLEVVDMDLDGDLDVFAGVNKHRARNLELSQYPVVVYLNDGTGKAFEAHTIDEDGIYNGRVADLEGDGDYDLFRLDGHQAKSLVLYENLVR